MVPHIPKIIHLCWFSGDEYPAGIQECLDSWKRVIPDYRVKLWTKEMALATEIPFVKEAIEQCKWAFAADAIRVYALYHDGGVYADSDIYFLKRFDEYLTDSIILFNECTENLYKKNNPSERFDQNGRNLWKEVPVAFWGIQAALMIAEPGQSFMKQLLDYYSGRHFIKEDGTLRMDLAPQVIAMQLENWGYCYREEEQKLKGNITVYPSFLVGGNNCLCFKESFAVHCVSHSWKPATLKEKVLLKVRKIIKKILFMKDKAVVKSFEKY